MVTLAEVTAQHIGKAVRSVVRPIALSRGTLVTRDLGVTRRLLEEAFGMECVSLAPDRILARHRSDRAGASYWILEIQEVGSVEHPQKMLNHWGFEAATADDVNRIHDVLAADAARYGLRRVHPVKANHGSYSFYCEDSDSNWWEIEHRDADISYAASVAQGDPT